MMKSSISSGFRTTALACLLLFAPVLALAHDESEQRPLDPESKRVQITMYSAVAISLAIFGAWYGLRRWQTVHGGDRVDGGNLQD